MADEGRGTIPATGLDYPRDWPVNGMAVAAVALVQRYAVGTLTAHEGQPAPELAALIDEDARELGLDRAAYARTVRGALGHLATVFVDLAASS